MVLVPLKLSWGGALMTDEEKSEEEKGLVGKKVVFGDQFTSEGNG